jgi:hypothetical protein
MGMKKVEEAAPNSSSKGWGGESDRPVPLHAFVEGLGVALLISGQRGPS